MTQAVSLSSKNEEKLRWLRTVIKGLVKKEGTEMALSHITT